MCYSRQKKQISFSVSGKCCICQQRDLLGISDDCTGDYVVSDAEYSCYSSENELKIHGAEMSAMR